MQTIAAPDFTSQLIERPRLLADLDAAEARGVRAICLVAPAGYGKTVLAEQWVKSRHPDAIWHYANEASADPVYLATALGKSAEALSPGISDRIADLARGSGHRDLADALIGPFQRRAAEPWLVIDDFHLLGTRSSARLVVELLTSRSVRLLVTSRTRPEFASARSLLYEETFLVLREQFEFDELEIDTLLRTAGMTRTGGDSLPRWPVVARLALNRTTPPTVPATNTELFGFIANEVFPAIPTESREILVRISICPTVTLDVGRAVSGPHAAAALADGVAAGLLAARDDGGFTLHPLVREFFVDRFRALPGDARREAAAAAFLYHWRQRDFETASAIALLTLDARLLLRLIRASYSRALNAGRHETIRIWLEAISPRHPVAKLVSAELELAAGHLARAMSVAAGISSSRALRPSERSRALTVAGLAAFLSGEFEKSRDYYSRALDVSRSGARRADALWGIFTAVSVGDPLASSEALGAYRQVAPPSAETQVRLALGGLNSIGVRKQWLNALPEARIAATVVEDVEDPRIRASFWCIFADRLVYAGCCREARAALHALEEHSSRYGLTFVEPRMRIVQARLDLLERRFNRCSLRVQQAAEVAGGDHSVLSAADAIRQILDLTRRGPVLGQPDSAPPTTSAVPPAEVRCWEALGASARGEVDRAFATAETVMAESSELSFLNVARFAQAIAQAHADPSHAQPSLRDAAVECIEVGDVLTLVCAYRAWPEMLPQLLADPMTRSTVTLLLNTFDQKLGARFGLSVPRREEHAPSALSPRESEVLGLLVEGLTNREIARRLFIAESTAKLHVRRICAKLGVRSRTEAALRAIG